MHVEPPRVEGGEGGQQVSERECNNCHSADGHVAVRRGLRCVVARFEASPYLVNDSGGGGTFARKINGVSSPVYPRGDAAGYCSRPTNYFTHLSSRQCIGTTATYRVAITRMLAQ